MKNNKLTKQIALLFLCLIATNYFLLTPAIAATPTPTKSQTTTAKTATPTPKPSQNQIPENGEELEKIQKIKDIVASKVAELNLVEKRGIISTITEISGMKITTIDIKGNIRHIDIDELTKFDISDDDDAGISDLSKGSTYSFIGIYNKETQRLLARNINSVNSVPVYFEGAIESVDDDEFQIVLVNAKGEKKTVDIQSSTKTSLADASGDLVKSGFSKLEQNSRVLAVGFLDKKDKNIISAIRVIHFEDVPPSKEMQSHVEIEN